MRAAENEFTRAVRALRDPRAWRRWAVVRQSPTAAAAIAEAAALTRVASPHRCV